MKVRAPAVALLVLRVSLQGLVPSSARAAPPQPPLRKAAPAARSLAAPLADPLAACARLYAEVVFDGMVDYERLGGHADRRACAQALAEAHPPAKDVAQPAVALAFWVNAYNLLSLLALAEEPDRWSPQQDGGVLFRDRVFTIAGQRLTLDQIEREEIAALTRDPRVEFLLSCGSRSCGLLPPAVLAAKQQRADELSAEIEVAMTSGLQRWLARPGNLRVRHDEGVVEVGQLLQLDWHGGDFERAGMGLTRLIAEALRTRDPIASEALRAGRYRLAFRPYDWRLNRVRRTYLLP